MLLDRTSLKRNKQSFQSTALHSLRESRTVPRSHLKMDIPFVDMAMTFKSAQPQNQMSKPDGQESRQKMKEKVEQIAVYMAEQDRKFRLESGSKFMRHFYYLGISRTIQHPLLEVPQFVFDLYFREQIKRKKPSSPPVAVSQGYLKLINCLYYAIENTIIFIRVQDLLDCNEGNTELLPYIVHEVRNQVINIIELPSDNLLFQGCGQVLGVVHPWEMQFFAWQDEAVIANNLNQHNSERRPHNNKAVLKPLNYLYKFPIENVQHLAVAPDSRIFYFDSNGLLYQITPEQQTIFLVCKTGRYTIRNYINSSHNTFELLGTSKGKLAPLLNVAENIKQISRYLFPSTITTEALFCDSKRQLLMGLLVKTTKLVFGQDKQVFIVCYSIRKNHPTKLLHKMSQQHLLQKYLKHSPVSQPHSHYEIHTIMPAPSYNESANLIILTKSGIQIVMEIGPGEGKIVEIVRPPDWRIFDMGPAEADGQYGARDRNQYRVCSVSSTGTPLICSLARKDTVYTFAAQRTFLPGVLDINLKISSMDVPIYKSGSWKVSIHQLANPVHPSDPHSSNSLNEYSSQLLQPPISYLFANEAKLQLLTYIRPIDILFTTLHLIVHYEKSSSQFFLRYRQQQQYSRHNTNHNNNKTHRDNPQKVLSYKNILLSKLFIPQRQAQEFPLVTRTAGSKQQLCAMLLQLQMDSGGAYFYSAQAAGQIMRIWARIARGLGLDYGSTRIGDFGDFGDFGDENLEDNNFEHERPVAHSKIGKTQLYTYTNICKQIMQQCQGQVEHLCAQPMVKANIPSKLTQPEKILNKIQALTLLLSQLVQPIWSKQLNELKIQQVSKIGQWIAQFHQYMQKSATTMQVYHTDNAHVSGELAKLTLTIDRVQQLLLLIENVPTSAIKFRFCDCLLDGAALEESLFWAIHREYKAYVVKMWYSMFPFYISHDFARLVLLYGELQQIADRDQLQQQINCLPAVKQVPAYFIDYLVKIRKLDKEQIQKKLKDKNISIPKAGTEPPNPDFQLVIAPSMLKIVQKYQHGPKNLQQQDLQLILSALVTPTSTSSSSDPKLTISNKQSLLSFLTPKLPPHPKLSFISRCLTSQYELYRFYLNSMTALSKQSRTLLTHLRGKSEPKEKVSIDGETMELLKFNTIADGEQLRKLIWLTADLWLMADYCVLFQDFQALRAIFKDACNSFQGPNSKKYSSFAAYIERYLLNFAIKSNYSDKVLEIVCQVVDQYLESLPANRSYIQSWLQFNSLTSITDKLIWLPKMLVKLGYKPQNIVKIELQQLENIFNRELPLSNQPLYTLKFLTCYSVALLQTQPTTAQQLIETITQHLTLLQRNNNIGDKSNIGIRKMLNMLASQIQ